MITEFPCRFKHRHKDKKRPFSSCKRFILLIATPTMISTNATHALNAKFAASKTQHQDLQHRNRPANDPSAQCNKWSVDVFTFQTVHQALTTSETSRRSLLRPLMGGCTEDCVIELPQGLSSLSVSTFCSRSSMEIFIRINTLHIRLVKVTN